MLTLLTLYLVDTSCEHTHTLPTHLVQDLIIQSEIGRDPSCICLEFEHLVALVIVEQRVCLLLLVVAAT